MLTKSNSPYSSRSLAVEDKKKNYNNRICSSVESSGEECAQLLSRDSGNAKGPHESDLQECVINQVKAQATASIEIVQ